MGDTFPTKWTSSQEGPQCPNCGRQFTADGPEYYDEAGYTSEECDECGETFAVSVCTSTTWTCEPRALADKSPPREEKGRRG